MVGGLRERDYQLAAQKRNEACRRFDYHCQTARYFERESRLAEHFNSWSSRNNNCNDNKYEINKKSKAEKLERRKNNLRKLLRDEEADYKNEMTRVNASCVEKKKKNTGEESVEELKKKLEIKRAERALYYPNYYKSYQSSNGLSDSVTSCLRHYVNERHIHACRNYQASMEDTNLRNYNSSDNHGPKENSLEDHRSQKRHLLGQSAMFSPNVNSYDHFSHQPNQHTGERRHYETAVDNVDEGTNSLSIRDHSSLPSAGNRSKNGSEKSFGFSGQATISERRHYGQSSVNSARSLANTNLRQLNLKESREEVEIEGEEVADEIYEGEREEESVAEEVEESVAEEVCEETNDVTEEPEFKAPETRDYDNKKNWSTDNINFSWKYDDPAKRPVCLLTHNQLINQIQDLANRELQACKKQMWSEALRLRDMRNELELQREIEIFNQDDLNMNYETRRSEMMKISGRIKLINKRAAGNVKHLVYSEEARNLWEARVREDEKIYSKDDRAQREILLKQLEEEWAAMTLRDKQQVAETPVKHNKSHLQEEMEITSAAMKNMADTLDYYSSNEESKNSCTRNRDKGASSLIFLG